MTFDDGLLDDETALARADVRLRHLAESGARVRREAAAAAEPSARPSAGSPTPAARRGRRGARLPAAARRARAGLPGALRRLARSRPARLGRQPRPRRRAGARGARPGDRRAPWPRPYAEAASSSSPRPAASLVAEHAAGPLRRPCCRPRPVTSSPSRSSSSTSSTGSTSARGPTPTSSPTRSTRSPCAAARTATWPSTRPRSWRSASPTPTRCSGAAPCSPPAPAAGSRSRSAVPPAARRSRRTPSTSCPSSRRPRRATSSPTRSPTAARSAAARPWCCSTTGPPTPTAREHRGRLAARGRPAGVRVETIALGGRRRRRPLRRDALHRHLRRGVPPARSRRLTGRPAGSSAPPRPTPLPSRHVHRRRQQGGRGGAAGQHRHRDHQVPRVRADPVLLDARRGDPLGGRLRQPAAAAARRPRRPAGRPPRSTRSATAASATSTPSSSRIVLFSVGGLFALYEAYHKFHEVQLHPGDMGELDGRWWWVPLAGARRRDRDGGLQLPHGPPRGQQGPRRARRWSSSSGGPRRPSSR